MRQLLHKEEVQLVKNNFVYYEYDTKEEFELHKREMELKDYEIIRLVMGGYTNAYAKVSYFKGEVVVISDDRI